MKNIPLVTIVIPVYNGSDFLIQSIESALNQTYKNIEIIVIDDGSTDSTWNIIQSYKEKIRGFHKENAGVSSALNMAIKNMKGEFFSWLSHDDLYYPYKIEEQINFYFKLDEEKSIIFSNEIQINENEELISKKIDIFDDKHLPYLLLYRRFIGGCSLLIPKKAFIDAGLFNEEYLTVQDYDMWFRMMNKDYEFRYLPIISGKSRIHKKQTSNTLRKIHWEEKNKFFITVQEWLNPKLWIEQCDNRAKGFFKLAIEFKLNGENQVFYYDVKRGIEELRNQKMLGIKIIFKFIWDLTFQIIKTKISTRV